MKIFRIFNIQFFHFQKIIQTNLTSDRQNTSFSKRHFGVVDESTVVCGRVCSLCLGDGQVEAVSVTLQVKAAAAVEAVVVVGTGSVKGGDGEGVPSSGLLHPQGAGNYLFRIETRETNILELRHGDEGRSLCDPTSYERST